jgi:predicted nucleotidyltransferase
MRHSPSLDAVIPVLRQLILAELLLREARPMYRVELARKLGVSPSSLQRPLQAMARTGLLKVTRRGREVHYEADAENPLVPELRSLLRKSHGLLDVLRKALAPFAKRIHVAFVYGSMASGSEKPSSDADLLVVGDATLAELTPSLHRAEESLGRAVNAVLYPREKLREKLAARNHFLTAVLDKPKLFVVGTEHELEEAAGSGSRRAPPDERRGTRGARGRGRAQPRRRKG